MYTYKLECATMQVEVAFQRVTGKIIDETCYLTEKRENLCVCKCFSRKKQENNSKY